MSYDIRSAQDLSGAIYKIKELRIVSDSTVNDEKIEGYKKIIDFIEEAYNKRY